MINENCCGVYLITSKSTGQFYVGSATNMPFRKERHLRSLRAGKHHNPHLQKLFDANGEQDLEFSVICPCADRAEAYRIEAEEMDRRATSHLLLNIGKHSKGGDNLSRHPNRLDVIRRTSETLKASIEALDPHVRQQKYSRPGAVNGMRGRQHTKSARQKQSQAAIGNSRSAGRVMPEDQKRALSELAKQRTGTANGFYGRQHTTETKEKIRRSKLANPTIPKSRQAVQIDGITYLSIKQASQHTGLSRYVIKQRLADPAFPTYLKK